jgi:hypothetical protein
MTKQERIQSRWKEIQEEQLRYITCDKYSGQLTESVFLLMLKELEEFFYRTRSITNLITGIRMEGSYDKEQQATVEQTSRVTQPTNKPKENKAC